LIPASLRVSPFGLGLGMAAAALITRIGRRRITRAGTNEPVRVPPAGERVPQRSHRTARVAVTPRADLEADGGEGDRRASPGMTAAALITRIGRRRITRLGTNLAQTRRSPRLTHRGLTREAGMVPAPFDKRNEHSVFIRKNRRTHSGSIRFSHRI
jgi:hypothetical protein